ncbi:MAG: PPE domain-containing protein, partial [Mycobacteriaceae bacterium]|nr:PPE domain-containing protein [Mycobacteriaceae bacterium]
MKVDPAGLTVCAQRMLAALAELTGGHAVHPPLAPDGTSIGAAARLSAAGITLAATVSELVTALVGTAEQLASAAGGFAEQEERNRDAVASLLASDAVRLTGAAAPPPPEPPDLRPAYTLVDWLPGEAIAAALHTGNPNAAEGFIVAWTQLGAELEQAADLLRLIAANLPELWHSQAATPAVAAHLLRGADALSRSSARAHALAGQASRHMVQYSQAVADVPSPSQFQAVRDQLDVASRANALSGGKLSAAVAALTAQKAGLEGQAHNAYSAYTADTESTTAPESADDAAAGVAGPEQAGQLAAELPGMIPTMLAAAGGLVGGAA